MIFSNFSRICDCTFDHVPRRVRKESCGIYFPIFPNTPKRCAAFPSPCPRCFFMRFIELRVI